MDLVRLGLPYSSSYQPDALIEGYDSLIWTERWQAFGEFQLKTPRVDETVSLLPLDTLVSHLDTDDVHIVETHEINEDTEGRPVLTVTGRSLSSFLQHRWIEAKYNKRRKMARKYSNTDALAVLLHNAFDNGSGKDVTWGDDKDWSTLDRVPNVSITDSVPIDGNLKNHWLKEGELWVQALERMQKAGTSVRVIRPSTASDATIITVTAFPLSDRGKINRTYTRDITSLRFDIFGGRDRTENQNTNPKVIFSQIQGHVDNPHRLRSMKDVKTEVEVSTDVRFGDQYRNSTEAAYSGLRRRVGGIDAGSPDVPDAPERPDRPKSTASRAEKAAFEKALDKWQDDYAKWKNERDTTMTEFREDAKEDARNLLKSTRKVNIFDGDISPLAPYQYKKDYDLGDTVTLYGDRNTIEDMVVSEYVRSEDINGDVGYPTLIEP